jgi:hypothetical protein
LLKEAIRVDDELIGALAEMVTSPVLSLPDQMELPSMLRSVKWVPVA